MAASHQHRSPDNRTDRWLHGSTRERPAAASPQPRGPCSQDTPGPAFLIESAAGKSSWRAAPRPSGSARRRRFLREDPHNTAALNRWQCRSRSHSALDQNPRLRLQPGRKPRLRAPQPPRRERPASFYFRRTRRRKPEPRARSRRRPSMSACSRLLVRYRRPNGWLVVVLRQDLE
jgi:hypothetical protein